MNPPKTVLAWSLAGLCLALSLVVQCQIITRAPFHEDEAFYTAYSKDILHGRPFLTSEGVEKPPVFFYWQALFMAIGGEGQAAARLPNVAAVLIAIVFAFRMARRIYDDVTAGAIVVVLALSPFYALFGPTAFTDVIAVTLAIGSLERLSAKQWFWSGVLVAGSMFAKQYYALFLGYNVLAMAMIPSLRPKKAEAKQWALGVVVTSLPVIFWATFLNYPSWNIVRLAKHVYHTWNPLDSRWVSLLDWIKLCGHVLGSAILNGLFLTAVAFVFWDAKREPSPAKNEKTRWDLYWLLMVVSYVVALGLQRNVPHYDRYILLAVIPISILAGRAFAGVVQRLPSWGAIGASGLILLLLGSSFYRNVWRGGYKHGANYDVYIGLDRAFAYTHEHFASADGLLAFEGPGFLQHYYAYRSPYPVLSVTTQEEIFQRLREFAFNPVWLLANTENTSLAFANWPKDIAALWAPQNLFENGHYQVWEMRPSERFRNRSIAPAALAAGLQRLWKEPVQVRQLSGSRYEVRGQFPFREGIITSFTSVWSGADVYDNKTWMAGRIQETKSTFELKTDAARAALALRNRNIIGLRFEVGSENDLTIAGTLTQPPWPFHVVLRPAISKGNRIRVELRSLRVGSINLPAWLCRFASRYIPPQKMGLPHWAGDVDTIQLNPTLQTAVISAHSTL